MKLYVFERVQPNEIIAIVAESWEDAIRRIDIECKFKIGSPVDPKTGKRTYTRYSIADDAYKSWEVEVGEVFRYRGAQPHVMGG